MWVGLRVKASERNQSQTQAMTGGHVHSDEAVPRSVQKPPRDQGPGPYKLGHMTRHRAARQQELGLS